jgi:hypothetical protein
VDPGFIKLKEEKLKNKLLQIQHGDVLLQEVTNIPTGAVLRPQENPIIVARGEQTGHKHVIQSDKTRTWALTRNGVTELYLEIKAPVTIVHDEHKPLPIPTGIYRVGIVKEYDYLTRATRRVRD